MGFHARARFVAVLSLCSLLLTVTFQNCAEGLPDAAEQTLPSTNDAGNQDSGPNLQVPVAPLNLSLPRADLDLGESQTVQASGGKPPYAYSIVSGPATINASSGEMLAGQTLGAVTVRVTDAAETTLDKAMTVGTGYAASVVAGTITFTTPGTHSFTVPKFVKLNVEAKGAGGGGGGSNIDLYGGSAGAAGGVSSAMGVSAPGGPGGAGSNYYAGVNYYPSSDASPAGNGLGALGGQGGLYGLTRGQNGGAGGRSTGQFVIGQAGSPLVGALMSVTVGAGGTGGVNGTFFFPTNSGTNGSVTISWGP